MSLLGTKAPPNDGLGKFFGCLSRADVVALINAGIQSVPKTEDGRNTDIASISAPAQK